MVSFVSGIGFGLMYLPAIAIVAYWFNQKRAVAIGIALCGSGIGTCILSFLLPEMIEWVQWNGSLILLSALCCQSMVILSFININNFFIIASIFYHLFFNVPQFSNSLALWD